MSRNCFTTITLLLLATTSRAGTVLLSAASPTITLGQTIELTISIDSADPKPPSLRGLALVDVSLTRLLNVTNGDIVAFHLSPDLPTGSKILTVDANHGGANVGLGDNNFSAFVGVLYSVDFKPTVIGEYGFGFNPNGSNFALYTDLGSVDNFTLGPSVTVTVNAVPEPASLTLAGVCLGGLALRAWRRVAR
jgi:hypothetical protein